MKNYITILYFNHGINERINVGLLLFNDTESMVKIKKSKMGFVKKCYPESYKIFKLSVKSYVKHYRDVLPMLDTIKRHSNYCNGVFKIDAPSIIAMDFSKENFDRFFDKRI